MYYRIKNDFFFEINTILNYIYFVFEIQSSTTAHLDNYNLVL